MQDYRLKYLPGFLKDLDNAAEYISVKLKNPQAALELVDLIDEAIKARLQNAESFEQYHSRKDRQYPYYRIYVKNYTVYYVVIDSPEGIIMEVRRLLHERQDIRKNI